MLPQDELPSIDPDRSAVVLVFFLPGTGSPVSRVAIGLLYAAAFVPLTYWIDRLAYRNYLRRSGKS